MADLRIRLGSLTLTNPVLAAAGTLGYGLEFSTAVKLERLGALITKTLTFRPREGNPPPRLVETPAGMLNAVGLQNVGLEAFLSEKLPGLLALRVPLIVSVLAEAGEELALMVQRLEQANGVAAIELNLSCPNLRHRSGLWAESSDTIGSGLRVPGSESLSVNPHLEPPAPTEPRAQSPQPVAMVAHDSGATAAMVQVARQHTRKALIAKLSPDVTDVRPIAQAAERAGADALAIGNTFVGMSLDPHTRRSRLGTMTGGLSGPAIRPLAVYRVWYTAKIVRIPVIGIGGILRAADAIEFFLAGASAIAVGTAHFTDPAAGLRVVRGLERYLTRHGLRSLEELRGAINR